MRVRKEEDDEGREEKRGKVRLGERGVRLKLQKLP
jgi:hypothetical protein